MSTDTAQLHASNSDGDGVNQSSDETTPVADPPATGRWWRTGGELCSAVGVFLLVIAGLWFIVGRLADAGANQLVWQILLVLFAFAIAVLGVWLNGRADSLTAPTDSNYFLVTKLRLDTLRAVGAPRDLVRCLSTSNDRRFNGKAELTDFLNENLGATRTKEIGESYFKYLAVDDTKHPVRANSLPAPE